jgi:hypothetical protein
MARARREQAKPSDWDLWWDARTQAMQIVLGPMDDQVFHAVIPFDVGYDAGGRADVISFSRHLNGIVYATSELIGRNDQVANDLGNYELMICHREPNAWGPDLMSLLAFYTLEAFLNPRDTMELGSFFPEGSILAGLFFYNYATFQVRDRAAGLLLCVGITQAEMDACVKGQRDLIIQKLQQEGIYPFTDFRRRSVV